MGNINNYNFNNLDLKLSNSDYWDFFLASDEKPSNDCYGITSGDCFVIWYDFNNVNIYPNSATSATSIYSLVSWTGATNSGYTLNTIGLTGVDNGLITFDVITGDTTNQILLSALTGSTLVITSGDSRFYMNMVTGTTGNFIYPINYVITTALTGNYTNFCGGFYQGYYKLDGYTYEVLPVRVSNAWTAEFWLKPSSSGCTGYSGTILNDTYPNNKGFFFYMGARGENKFWTQFYGSDTGCTSACTQDSGCTGTTVSQWCTIPKETDITLIGDYGVGIPLSPPQLEIDLIKNPFLIYGQAYDYGQTRYTGTSGSVIYNGPMDPITMNPIPNSCGICDINHDGLGTQTACSYDGNGIVVVKTTQIQSNFQNPFLLYGRGSGVITGTSCNTCNVPQDGLGVEMVGLFSGITKPEIELNYKLDIIDNALGFRIKDDGSIGYRLLTVTGQCYTASTGERMYSSGITIQEEYSASGIVSFDSWSYVVIRFVTNYLDECQLIDNKPRIGKLMFYINGKLKFIVEEFDEFIAKRLNEYKDKQISVPFNFSLGGGSLGLLESQTFDGRDSSDLGLPIETNFAGTFIGGISQFKFNICDLSFCDIQNIYLMDANRYGISILNYGHC